MKTTIYSALGLNYDRWYDRIGTSARLRMKRVSALAEEQFPRRFRLAYQKGGQGALIKLIRAENPTFTLAEAWHEAKRMIGRVGVD